MATDVCVATANARASHNTIHHRASERTYALAVDLVPQQVVRCDSCGGDVGLVRLPRGRWRTVDLKPVAYGPIALLADGERAVDLTEPWIDPQERRRQYDPAFAPHNWTCPARGFKPLGAVLTRGGRRTGWFHLNADRRRVKLERERHR